MTASKPHSDPDVLTVYYGIHDALRELGDDLHDAGDGPGLDTPHVTAGLWDASSALSRLVEQLEAAQADAERELETARAYEVELAGLREQLEVLRGSLEAMLPGTLASEVEYQTNAAYHACAYIAKKALETTSNPASRPDVSERDRERIGTQGDVDASLRPGHSLSTEADPRSETSDPASKPYVRPADDPHTLVANALTPDPARHGLCDNGANDVSLSLVALPCRVCGQPVYGAWTVGRRGELLPIDLCLLCRIVPSKTSNQDSIPKEGA